MEATVKNEKIARAVIKVLADNNCTAAEAIEILHYASNAMLGFATVQQPNEKLF